MPLYIKERLSSYFGLLIRLKPAFLSFLSALTNGGTINLRDRSFATWMADAGKHFTAFEDQTPVARLTPLATGVVLDMGAGWGSQVQRFDRAKVAKVYGIEPNADFLPMLQKKIDACGMRDVYFPIICGIEDDEILKAHGILPGSLDTIVCMQVLCSVQDPKDVVRRMHRLLKPGGKLLFWEHQRSADVVTSWVQSLWNTFWKRLVGGCCLDKEVEKAILTSAEWEVEEFGSDDTKTQPWLLLPRVWGVLVKN